MLAASVGDTGSAARARLESVDLVRGVAMILMALDHTRDFFGITGQNPTGLASAGAALFLTRWITNFCAPTFFLLAGVGAALSLRHRSPAGLARHLFTRGLWLIFLEIVVLRCLAYQFNFDYRVTMLLVLWALGWSMITLAAFVRLPSVVAAFFGIVLVAGHNLLDSFRPASALWSILHAPGIAFAAGDHVVFVAYPLVPWIGVTAVGYALGKVYDWEPCRRRQFLAGTGLVLCAAFFAIRGFDDYGDPAHWRTQATPLMTALSFLDTTKYPPSLSFLLMTLGPVLLLLAIVDRPAPHLLRPVAVIGKVPLFYYVLHFALIHALAALFCEVRHGSMHWMAQSPDLAHYPFTPPPGWGFGLPLVYLTWGIVVTIMYPPCRWFAALKQRRRDEWLSYL